MFTRDVTVFYYVNSGFRNRANFTIHVYMLDEQWTYFIVYFFWTLDNIRQDVAVVAICPTQIVCFLGYTSVNYCQLLLLTYLKTKKHFFNYEQKGPYSFWRMVDRHCCYWTCFVFTSSYLGIFSGHKTSGYWFFL